MPVYNGAKYLHESIQSILNQTYKNFELIIIDDGSTDNSIEIINSFIDKRIKVLRNSENKGLAYTRNKAVKNSSGKYIAILDCDDIAYPERLSKQVEFLETYPEFVMVGSSFEIIDEQSEGTGEKIILDLDNNLISTQLFFCNYFAQSSVMMKREVFNDFQYNEDYTQAEDYHLWSQISTKYKLANLHEILVKYRSHNESISNTKNFIQEINVKKIYRYHLLRLGLKTISEDIIELHYQILRNLIPVDKIGKKTTFEVLNWLNQLLNINIENKILDPTFFYNELQKYWVRYFNSTFRLGIISLKYITSKFNKDITSHDILLYFAKCFYYEIINRIKVIRSRS